MRSSVESSPWLVRPRPDPRADLRLFCFPYAGGGASPYVSWAGLLSPRIDVSAVRLPGRETRARQTAYRHADELVAALGEAFGERCTGRFAFFGHCMGGLLAFELARWLRRHGHRGPEHLFVAGRRAPQLPRPGPLIHELPDTDFAAAVAERSATSSDVLLTDRFRGVLLPLLRADFAVNDTHTYRPEPPLTCPITALGGRDDGDVPPWSLAAWREHTSADFRTKLFDGAHFFPATARSDVLDTVRARLLGEREESPRHG
ncbi:thioesterase domain-containing protein [Streptomyces sp. NPDC026589]|uniref:thioesterase II family protein n=1 Tax=Streptomyces sp. NPDC026589 TaxID=3155609 RepID=UPI0033C6FE20